MEKGHSEVLVSLCLGLLFVFAAGAVRRGLVVTGDGHGSGGVVERTRDGFAVRRALIGA